MERWQGATYIDGRGGLAVSMRRKLIAIVLAMLAMLGVGAATGAANAQAARFGVALHPAAGLPGADEFARMDRGKVGSIRLQLYWPQIQDAPSDCSATTTLLAAGCDWSETDQLVAQAAQKGIHVLPFFYGTPSWLRPAGRSDASSPVATAYARTKWKDFVKAAVQRYGPGGAFWDTYSGKAQPIRTWQIWNEQNSKAKWAPRPSPRDYSTLLKLAHAAITGVDRDARLMLGGMFGTPFASGGPSLTAWKFLARLYDVKGIKSKFDLVAAHPYSENLRGIKYQVDKLRRVMKANGDRRTKLAVTEVGWGSGKPRKNSFLLKGLKGQSQMLKNAFRLFNDRQRSWKLGTVYWFSLKDSQDCGEYAGCSYWESSAGLLRAGEPADPKPAWRAFTRFTGGKP